MKFDLNKSIYIYLDQCEDLRMLTPATAEACWPTAESEMMAVAVVM